MRIIKTLFILYIVIGMQAVVAQTRHIEDFDKGWKFYLGDVSGAEAENFSDDN